MAKTNLTAVIIMPPEEVWEPIQAIRKEHDRNIRRWMPHITMIFPFRYRREFHPLAKQMEAACGHREPLELTLETFGRFEHPRGTCTVWLRPSPAELVTDLQEVLQDVVPDCDDVWQFKGGFNPHLSVGQAENRDAADDLIKELQADWKPLTFTADRVHLISRKYPPEDVFRIGATAMIGKSSH